MLVADAVCTSGVTVLVVGNGSNLLVADAGFAGLALMLGAAYEDVAVAGTVVTAGGAASLPVVARRTAAAGLAGFEWAVGVPGSIGGAVRMNAGGHGSDMAASLTRVRVVDLRTGDDGWMAASDLALAYRHSSIAANQLAGSHATKSDPSRPPIRLGSASSLSQRRTSPNSLRYPHAPATEPGKSATVLVALAITLLGSPAGRINNSAGNVSSVPPPANEFMTPAASDAAARMVIS